MEIELKRRGLIKEILATKMSDPDNKIKIQKLQQELDRLSYAN